MGELTNYSDPAGDLLGVLRDRRRRLVIYALRNRPQRESVTVEELATSIVMMESDGREPWTDARGAGAGLAPTEPSEAADEPVVDRVCISLVHVHLPKLHENGLVDYDAANGTVRAVRPPEEFWERLRSHQQFSDSLAATELD